MVSTTSPEYGRLDTTALTTRTLQVLLPHHGHQQALAHSLYLQPLSPKVDAHTLQPRSEQFRAEASVCLTERQRLPDATPFSRILEHRCVLPAARRPRQTHP